MEEIEIKIKNIIANHAYKNNFELDSDFVAMAKTVKYLVFQINFLKKYDDFEEDFKTHIDFIIENTNKLL